MAAMTGCGRVSASRPAGTVGVVGVVLALGGALVVSGCDTPPTSLIPASNQAQWPACRAPAGRTTLDDGASDGPVGWTWISGDQVLYSTTSAGIRSVPLAGGAATEIAPAASGVGVVAGMLYYTAEHAAGPPSSDGRQSSAVALYAAPFTGGPIDASAGALIADNFSALATATDGASLYVAAAGGSILRLTPPDPSPVTLTLDGTLAVRALAADGQFLYAAVGDLSNAPGDGLIVRMPKTGGPTDRLTPPAGFPDGLAVDSGGLYWIQQPPVGTFGNATIRHADLTGGNVTTLVDGKAGSPGVLALGPSHLYFLADELERIGKQGGAVEVLTPALPGAGLLQVSGSDVVWVDNATRALSSTAATTLEVFCAAPATVAANGLDD